MPEMSSVQPAQKPKFPFRIRIEPRLNETPLWLSLLLTLAAIGVALVLGAVVIWYVGGDPIESYLHIAKASMGDIGVFSDTMVKAIPLMLVGLACSLAFRMRLWNIGAEGQFFIGAFGASAVVLIPILPETAPKWLFILLMLIAGMLCGAVWGFIPGYLKAKMKKLFHSTAI